MCALQSRILVRLREVAAGVSYLHSRNVLHGDLKLANVMLQHSNTASFGYIAKVSGHQLLPFAPVTCFEVSDQSSYTVAVCTCEMPLRRKSNRRLYFIPRLLSR